MRFLKIASAEEALNVALESADENLLSKLFSFIRSIRGKNYEEFLKEVQKNSRYPDKMREMLQAELKTTFQDSAWVSKNVPEQGTSLEKPGFACLHKDGNPVSPKEVAQSSVQLVNLVKKLAIQELPKIRLRQSLIKKQESFSENDAEKMVEILKQNLPKIKAGGKFEDILKKNSIPVVGSNQHDEYIFYPDAASATYPTPDEKNYQEYVAAVETLLDRLADLSKEMASKKYYVPYWDSLGPAWEQLESLEYGAFDYHGEPWEEWSDYVASSQSHVELYDVAENASMLFVNQILALLTVMYVKK